MAKKKTSSDRARDDSENERGADSELDAPAEFEVISFKTVEEIESSIVESPFRAIYQTNNFLLPQLKGIIDEDKTVNLRPEYQRRSRWTNKQKSLLIESFLLNIPIPPIFLFEGELARYEVMDGQQRLLTIREFFTNQFRLSSLSILAPLNGRTYARLPTRTRKTLDRASLSAIVLLKESRSSLRESSSKRVLELRKFVFERLNTGGKHLNAQEIRNAIYSGPFNDLIVGLTRSSVFTETWGIPRYSEPYSEADYESLERRKNTLYKTMGDCQIVLRFFALRELKAIKGSMRSILDRCMERNLGLSKSDAIALREEYLERLKLARSLFSDAPFRLSKATHERPSESMYDAVMVALDRLWEKRKEIVKARREIQRLYWSALRTPEKIEQFSGRANTAADVKQRIEKMEKLFKAAMKNA